MTSNTRRWKIRFVLFVYWLFNSVTCRCMMSTTSRTSPVKIHILLSIHFLKLILYKVYIYKFYTFFLKIFIYHTHQHPLIAVVTFISHFSNTNKRYNKRLQIFKKWFKYYYFSCSLKRNCLLLTKSSVS